MRKRVLALAVLLVPVLVLVAACGASSIPKGAIVKVGEGAVTQAQFDQIINEVKAQSATAKQPFPAETSAQYLALKANIVNYLVLSELINQQAATMKLSVTDKQVSDRVAEVEKAYGGEAKVVEILKGQGMTLTDWKALLKSQLLGEAVQKKVFADAKIADVASITDQQAQAYFDANKSQFAQPETRDVRHILVKTKAVALKVRALLAANPSVANWNKLAAKYSIDPGTSKSGGLLSGTQKGQMVAAFDKVAFSQKVGQVSPPVQTQFGWHVIEVVKITPAVKADFAKLKAQIKQTLLSDKQGTTWDAWIAKVKKDTKILYLKGFDPAELNKQASSAPSATPSAVPPATQSSSPAPSPSASK
jgi:foldase protein PrsA